MKQSVEEVGEEMHMMQHPETAKSPESTENFSNQAQKIVKKAEGMEMKQIIDKLG